MIPADPTAELFADQPSILCRLLGEAIATHPIADGVLLRRALDLVDGFGDPEGLLHDGEILTALCDHASALHAAGDHAAALAWGKAAYVANRRFAHAWLNFLDIALGAQAIAQTGLVTANPHPSFLERLKRPRNIPPTIMQYWDKPQPPGDVAALIEGWARQSPKYTHRLFDDAKARAFLSVHCDERVLTAYDAAPNVASRSDIFRLAWLVHNGGIYVDADEQLLGNLDALLPADTGLVMNWSAGPPPCINNWFIAARPRHPMVIAQLRLAVSQILDVREPDPRLSAWVLTGPGVFTMVLLDQLCFSSAGRVLADVVLQAENDFRTIVEGGIDLAYRRDPDLNWRSGYPVETATPDKISIVAFGHSHLGALQRAYEDRGDDFPARLDVKFLQLWGRYDPFFRNEAGTLIYNQDLVADLKDMARQAGASKFVSALLGSEHLIWAVEGQSQPFDVILPFAPDLPINPGVEIVPYAPLRETASKSIGEYLMFSGWLQNATKLPVYLVLPPPPVANQDFLMPTATASMQEIMSRHGIPHWTIRYKLWRIWNAVAMDIANRMGVAVIDAPDGVTDFNGLLRDENCADSIHANARYGLLMWQKLAKLFGAGTA